MEKETAQKALEYHANGQPGKIAIAVTKPIESPEDFSLAYTPGVAAPSMEIYKERWNAYRYTNKGNLVAIISNGSSVLGLGDIGALASKPVMEGKSMLFKIFADIDAFDIEIGEEDPDKFIATVQSLAPTFGGINLEDIKAPECFYIEERLRALLDIPVLHDDQHGTAVVVAAALMNACEVAGKQPEDIAITICGAGSAAVSTARMLNSMGIDKKHIIMVDSKGVINTQRTDLNSIKSEFATERRIGTLQEAMNGADAFIGLSRGNLLEEKEIMAMKERPVIFALANPTPEISYSRAKSIRPDAIVATGRSDAPNQVNNALAFPYLFRGALDTLSTTINNEMKIAAAHAIASVAHDIAEERMKENYGNILEFGDEYILPKPGDRNLLCKVSVAVAKAAMQSGVARRGIASFKEYADTLMARTDHEHFFSKKHIRHRRESDIGKGNRQIRQKL